eukprot:EG_transcript_9527
MPAEQGGPPVAALADVELAPAGYGPLGEEPSNGNARRPGRCGCCGAAAPRSALWVAAVAYSAALLATLVKTVAWWFNQWPFMVDQPLWAKWLSGAGIAGLEYCPMTFAMGYGAAHGVSLSLMTASMEATDNLLRMLQQVVLGKPLAWFDWGVAAALVLCVLWQGWHHRLAEIRTESKPAENEEPSTAPPAGCAPQRIASAAAAGLVFVATGASLAGFGGWTGKAYALAVAATAAKTFAWWVNQYPCLRRRPFAVRWGAGWSIAAVIEYCPLVAAFDIASDHAVHLGLLTAFMEALDNVCRMCQMWLLAHPLRWYDYAAAAGMVLAVAFQGAMRASDPE